MFAPSPAPAADALLGCALRAPRPLPGEPAHPLPDEWDDTPARGIQLPQETHSKFMAKPHSGLSQ